MFTKADIKEVFNAAVPIMLGYVAIGLPCGILSSSIGLSPWQALALSYLFYSGAGQFMIANMWLAATPISAIIASVSMVNMRQMLYSASFAPWCRGEKKGRTFFFAATVTDESFGVNMAKFMEGNWSVAKAGLLNITCCTSWAFSNFAGVLIGNAVGLPLAIASFAMTSIFICLLFTQKMNKPNVIAAIGAVFGVIICKCLGLAGAAILIGALIGIGVALIYQIVVSR
ncbi:MAG: AzlC family ABC transporter permease [Eggerthellaceae bacterium]